MIEPTTERALTDKSMCGSNVNTILGTMIDHQTMVMEKISIIVGYRRPSVDRELLLKITKVL